METQKNCYAEILNFSIYHFRIALVKTHVLVLRIKCYICSGREDCEICPSSVSQPNNLLSETKILIANISPTRDYKLHVSFFQIENCALMEI